MFFVYRTIGSLRGGCIYKGVDVMAVRVWCLLYVYVTLCYGYIAHYGHISKPQGKIWNSLTL